MDSYKLSKDKKLELNQLKSNILENIKSKYILEYILNYLKRNKSLIIIKYNKKFQNSLNISKNTFKECVEIYSPIDIEIIPNKIEYGKFINIPNKEELYYHIYFEESKNEIKRNYLNKNENISKIKIIIDYQVKSFSELFYNCRSIKSIAFKKFNRININNMSSMFWGCLLLKNINFSNFNTTNVTDMSNMFSRCSSLEELNLSNFNTNNVTDMSCMFSECSSLRNLDLSYFNINKLDNMNFMFSGCSSLKEINFLNFKNVTKMSCMFLDCSNGLKMKINATYYNC